jgi:hypothetical protein
VADKVALGQISSEYFGFPCQFGFLRLLQTSTSSSSYIIWGWYRSPQLHSTGPLYVRKLAHKTIFKGLIWELDKCNDQLHHPIALAQGNIVRYIQYISARKAIQGTKNMTEIQYG